VNKRLNKLHKKTVGVGSAESAHDRTITITADEWNKMIENVEILEDRIENDRKEFADFLKKLKRGK
jgi:hypothetical protein